MISPHAENENDEPMISGPSQFDVVVSMKDESYRNAMFRLFANLGSRGYKEDNTHGPASEQLHDFKKHMGPHGNFLRRRHGGRGGFHFTLLTEEQALERACFVTLQRPYVSLWNLIDLSP